jgi:hypothetical protein
MRIHFYPQQWLLCHMGLYSFEFVVVVGGGVEVVEVVVDKKPTTLLQDKKSSRQSHTVSLPM